MAQGPVATPQHNVNQGIPRGAHRPLPHPQVDSPMPLHPLHGHEGPRNRLAGAIASGRLPQALLFEGPRGVGKQRLALWLGQLLLCERQVEREPCGECRSCHLALALQHPDLHWFVPVEVIKKGADADKQVDLVEEALALEMVARRHQPLYEAAPGLASHGIASVRLLLRRLALTPAMGPRKVFIIGDAERLIPQQGAEAAAPADSYAPAGGPHPTSRYAYALRQPAYQARGAFTAMLDELLELLRAEAHEGATSQVVAALARVLEAREMAQGNVNPQLLTAVLSEDLAGGGGGGVRRWPKSA